MLGKDVLCGLVLSCNTDYGQKGVEGDFLQCLDGRIRVTVIDELVKVEKVDERACEVLLLESYLGHWVSICQLADEETNLSSNRQ